MFYVKGREKLVDWLRKQLIGPASEGALGVSPLDRYPTADLGVKGAGAGPEVRARTASDKRESAALIALEIVELVDQGHLAPGSVTVLSPFEMVECICKTSCAGASATSR